MIAQLPYRCTDPLSNPISLEPLFTMLQPSCTMANCIVTKLSYDNLIRNDKVSKCLDCRILKPCVYIRGSCVHVMTITYNVLCLNDFYY